MTLEAALQQPLSSYIDVTLDGQIRTIEVINSDLWTRLRWQWESKRQPDQRPSLVEKVEGGAFNNPSTFSLSATTLLTILLITSLFCLTLLLLLSLCYRYF